MIKSDSIFALYLNDKIQNGISLNTLGLVVNLKEILCDQNYWQWFYH